PCCGTTVAGGIVGIRLRAESDDADEAESMLVEVAREVRDRVGPLIWGEEDQTLAAAVIDLLGEKKLSLATAESCTGGQLGGALTDIPGASTVYRGGWVVYDNGMKQEHLGVDPERLKQHGAVSEPVAAAMARGAAERAPADLALSITGIAGPGGGSEEKPIGTVWIGLTEGDNVHTLCFHFRGDRARVRQRTVHAALQVLRLHLIGESFEQMQFGRRDSA
ncbi:MAG: nicotinamide-nucleotide amidohydrolase family protein, partial [Phycisphaeraceae bacterium]|nr:nicotinamide-nucleotide amidohydrolase family protein [Phycisphaeraceae bacterium]